ncbi:ATP-grasp domain-containing protein [Longimicrobium sp.]|uniref:ATP-grasp domain-containing protein n=1 Tax=Longimicrobium sp. TaxID=2029185 RepID=UPI003B3B5B59
MTRAGNGGGALLFIESNTSGTGRLFVHTARELGFAPVLITAKPEKYAYLSQAGAPETIVVPRVDEDALDALIRERFDGGAGVAGITSSSEYFIATAAALAARFGLPGPDAASVRAARDKSHQRRATAAAGIAAPAFRVAASAAEAVAAAREIGFPVVVKPVDGSGSMGVRACAGEREVEEHAAPLFAAGGAETRLLVEGFVEGHEFSVEVFSGRVIGITRKHLGRPPYFVEAGHDYPAAESPEIERTLTDAVVRATEVLGLGWGPLHWEMRITADGRAVPMEVNPRLAGGFIPELVRHAQGIDLIRETLRLVVGQAPQPAAARHRYASIRFLFAPAAGRLEAVEGLDEARAREGVVDVSLYRPVGSELTIEGDFRDRIGHVVACTDESEAACTAAEGARGAIRIVVAAPESADDAALVGAGEGAA